MYLLVLDSKVKSKKTNKENHSDFVKRKCLFLIQFRTIFYLWETCTTHINFCQALLRIVKLQLVRKYI